MTAKAKAHIEAREYRFISPVFRHHRQTRAVTRIEGAALVNDPALHMRAIAGATGASGAGLETEDDEEDPMADRKDTKDTQTNAALAAALGLKADADGAAILAATKAAMKGASALAGVAKTLGLEEDADDGAIEAGALAAAGATGATGGDGPDPKQWVPRGEFDRPAKRLETVEGERADERAATAVAEATSAGKIAPAQGDWALAYAKKDPKGFADYVEAASAIVTPGRMISAAPPAGAARAGAGAGQGGKPGGEPAVRDAVQGGRTRPGRRQSRHKWSGGRSAAFDQDTADAGNTGREA